MKLATTAQPAQINPPETVGVTEESESGHHFEWIEYARVALVGIAAILAWTDAIHRFHGFDLFALAAARSAGIQSGKRRSRTCYRAG